MMMKLHVVFIGNKFIYNKPLREYSIRKIEEKSDFVSSYTYYQDGDNAFFLELEEKLQDKINLIIITTKQNFSTLGKVLCTITSDNQVLKENMLIPQKSSLFEEGSYLLEYNGSVVNVLHVNEMQKMPELLIDTHENKANIHIFEEDKESVLPILNPIAQTYDVSVDIVTIIDGWLRVDISSNRYGNLSKFIKSAKQLLPHKLISASNVIGHIIESLSRQNKTITFAESCTGGLLSYYFTKNNGASKILHGSLVTYSNELKENWLAVEQQTLEEEGAVSYGVVEQMSDGAINVSHADYSLSISGIAGEGGGTELKPVGTVYIGVRHGTTHYEMHLKLEGDRNYIQEQSALHAIKMLVLTDRETFF